MTEALKGSALLSPDVVHVVYRRGLELAPGKRAALVVLTTNGSPVRLSVGNCSEGLVEVACADPLVCEELCKFVGIRVVPHVRAASDARGES